MSKRTKVIGFTSLNELKCPITSFFLFTYDLQTELDKKRTTNFSRYSRHFQQVSSKFLLDVKFFQFFKVVTYTILLLDGSSPASQKWQKKNQHVNNWTCWFVWSFEVLLLDSPVGNRHVSGTQTNHRLFKFYHVNRFLIFNIIHHLQLQQLPT